MRSRWQFEHTTYAVRAMAQVVILMAIARFPETLIFSTPTTNESFLSVRDGAARHCLSTRRVSNPRPTPWQSVMQATTPLMRHRTLASVRSERNPLTRCYAFVRTLLGDWRGSNPHKLGPQPRGLPLSNSLHGTVGENRTPVKRFRKALVCPLTYDGAASAARIELASTLSEGVTLSFGPRR